MKNLTASIQFKLKQLAAQESITYQLILIRYFQERLLYRLHLSRYNKQFCLKGGALLYAFDREKSRPTMDIDLLGLKIQSDLNLFKTIFEEICQTNYDLDAVVWNLNTISTAEIKKEDKYSGVRVKVMANLGNIKQLIQIDVGFGDIITPHPLSMVYPTLLEMDAPKIQVYSLETVIAEKFEAMISLGVLNSRMKDFYDLFRLLQQRTFDPIVLKQAIINTFRNRKTGYQSEHPLFLQSFVEDEKRVIQWKSFLRKSSLQQDIDFGAVLTAIRTDLLPIYESLNTNI